MGYPQRHRVISLRSWAILSSFLVLVLLIPGCGILGNESGMNTGDQHLRLAGSTFGISSLDPALVRDVETAFFARQVFRGLVRLDDSLQVAPELAESIEVSPDGLNYTFTIHESATFHDGSPLNAQAVVRSFNRASDPALAEGDGSGLSAATYFSDIVGIDERLDGRTDTVRGITAIGTNTVRFTLKRPSASFLSKLSGSPALIVDTLSINSDTWWHTANGSGPFRIASYEPGAMLTLESFDMYPGGRPKLNQVSIVFGTEATQPLNLYQAERIDLTHVPSWALDRVLTPSDALHDHVVSTEQLSTTFFGMNPTVAPYDDPDLRRAIVAAFDVDRMIEIALDGRAQRAHGLIPPGIGDREWRSQPIDYNLNQAREFLAQAGGLGATPVIVEPGAGISSILSAILLRDLGLTVDVVDQPWPEFASRLGDSDLPALVLTWVADYPDPENTLATLLRTGSPDNYLGYSNPVFDDLVDRAAIETDAGRREELYMEAQQLVLDDAIVLPLYHGMSYTLVQPRVRGLVITEIGILYLDDVWIEDRGN
jgi:oligopeptide transport system substrate-binding protein